MTLVLGLVFLFGQWRLEATAANGFYVAPRPAALFIYSADWTHAIHLMVAFLPLFRRRHRIAVAPLVATRALWWM